jgi:hypothetical protein
MRYVKWGAAALAAIFLCIILGHVIGIFGEAAQVTHDEFGPRAALAKYEQFKDESAQLDAKVADIAVLQHKIDNLEAQYQGVPRNKWARTDTETINQWQTERDDTVISYNSLAATYNADMAKFNYRFANQGELPQGAENPLPREYKPYRTQ